MKKAIVSMAVFAVLAVANQAAILTQWNFNSDPPDNPQNLGTGAIASESAP